MPRNPLANQAPWRWLLTWAVALPALAADVELVYHPRDTLRSPDGAVRLVIEDADGHGGTAQAAVPGTSKPGTVITSFYSYARPGGRYRTVWRAKVDDNTLADVVFTGSTSGGGAGYANGSVAVKGTDFAAPGTYQEFSYVAEKGEGGFFGVSAVWSGQGRVLIDRVTVVSEELFREEELVRRGGGMELPDEWLLPPATPARIHVVKGLWWDFFGVSEAAAELGGTELTSSYHAQGQYGTSLRHFPPTWQALASHNLVVLANIDALALGPRGRLLLAEYVRHGGALLVLGGPFAFGPGGYRHTALEALLPVQMTDDTRVQAGAPLALKAGPGAAGILPDDLAWEMQPHAYWHHAVEARPEARVLVTAGGQPVLTAWEVGAGRVAALAVTAEGDPGADELPFWEWGDMPRLLASVCTWLLSAPRPAKTYTVDAESRRQLEQLAVASPTDDQEQRQRQLTTLLMRCREPAFAREIIEAVEASPATPDRPFTDAVWGAVRPHIDGTFAAAADALIASRDPGKADLGLRVLGQARPPKAASRLKHFLEHGLDGFEAGTGADLFAEDTTLPVTTAGDIAANERLRLAAVCALGELGDAASLDALRAVTREFSGKRQQLSEVTDLPDLNEGLYQQSLGARCRLGDADAAVPYLDVIAHNADDIEQFQNALDEMLVTKDDKRLLHMRKLAGMRLPGLHRRQALCMQTLRQSPYAVGAACARELAKRDDPRLAPFAFAALCPAPARPPDPAVRDSLLALVRDCPTPEVRLLAFRVCRSNPDAEAGRLAAALLPELATAESAAGARFALRRVPQLPTSERAAVIAAGLRHADPGVSRLARLSLALLPAGQRQAVEEAAGAAAKAE